MKGILKLVFMVGLAFLIAACSSNSSGGGATPGGGDQSTGKGDGNAKAEKLVLRSTIHAPDGIPYTKGYDAFLDEIEKRTDGRIEFERYYAASLLGTNNIITGIGGKVADIGVVLPAWNPGILSLGTVTSNPFIYNESYAAAKAVDELYRSIPAMSEELEKNKMKYVGQYALPAYYLYSAKPISSLDDIKGLKLIATAQVAELAKSLGAVPIAAQTTEAYELISKGTADGLIISPEAIMSYKLDELITHVYMAPMGGHTGLYVMNLDVWNSLPADIQQIIQEISSDFQPRSYREIIFNDDVIDNMKSKGITFVEPTAQEMQKLEETTKVLWDAWVKEQASNGLPGQEVLDKYIEFVKKYEADSPYKK